MDIISIYDVHADALAGSPVQRLLMRCNLVGAAEAGRDGALSVGERMLQELCALGSREGLRHRRRRLAGGPGFEPGLLGPEPRVLPLNYPPNGPQRDR
jgi:hypothetical protein